MTITTEGQYEAALVKLDVLMDRPELDVKSMEKLVHLADLIEAYEDIVYPIGNPSIFQRLLYRVQRLYTLLKQNFH
jgi:antitoxin component HigA of HigAB toxin-antitoxin module